MTLTLPRSFLRIAVLAAVLVSAGCAVQPKREPLPPALEAAAQPADTSTAARTAMRRKERGNVSVMRRFSPGRA